MEDTIFKNIAVGQIWDAEDDDDGDIGYSFEVLRIHEFDGVRYAVCMAVSGTPEIPFVLTFNLSTEHAIDGGMEGICLSGMSPLAKPLPNLSR